MKHLYFLIILCLAWLTTACETNTIEIELASQPPSLVVNALFDTFESDHYVYVHLTDIDTPVAVGDAEVEILVNGQSIIAGRDSYSGRYTFRHQFHEGDEVEVIAKKDHHRCHSKVNVEAPIRITHIDTTRIDGKNGKEVMRVEAQLEIPEGMKGPLYFRVDTYTDVTNYDWFLVQHKNEEELLLKFKEDHMTYRRIDLSNNIALKEATQNENDYYVYEDEGYGNPSNIFRDVYFNDRRYTLTMDVELNQFSYRNGGFVERLFLKVHRISHTEYLYMMCSNLASEDTDNYIVNPIIVPSNMEGGTGLLSVSAVCADSSIILNDKRVTPDRDELHGWIVEW